jgi:hypothetical protein
VGVALVAWRRPHVGVALPALVLTLGAFMFLPQMHERYSIGALPFAIMLAVGWATGRSSRRWGAVAVALSTTQFLNLIAVGSPLPALWTNVFADGGTGPLAPAIALAGYAAAAVNLVVLAWALRELMGLPGAAQRKEPA